ncbi:MAG: DinB family protein [Chloroflexi bacterium]|nr:DinB family protein [Chloroflexota bacterium]
MSKLELIRALYEYNDWANNCVLAAASGLSEGELRRPLGASYGSVRGNLAHIVRAQAGWYWRWTGEGLELWRAMGSDPAFSAVREAFAVSHKQMAEFVGGLAEDEVARTLTYVDREGTERQRPLWQLMLHVVNHGTQHRSETAMALTELGRSPGDLDYVYFELGRA